jgi:hypothetical protein
MSSYDAWKSAVGDWPSVEDPPCADCGVLADEACTPDRSCAFCAAPRRLRDGREQWNCSRREIVRQAI